jgi:starch phosphorylase
MDVWINTPRRPWEACGTSGMKVLGNGGLNRSELDGWWAEAYTPEVGWALGNGEEHWEPGWDAVEAEQLYRLLEQEVVPAFYDRDAAGVPRAWVARMRASMSRLAPQFSTNRMAREYVRDIYLPSATAFQRRVAQGGQLARELCDWESLLRKHWQELHFGNLVVNEEPDGWLFELQVYLADIPPDFVQVQLYAESFDSDTSACEVMERGAGIPGALNGYIYFYRVTALRPYTDFTPRIVACHREAHLPLENNLIVWWTGTAELRRNLR